MLSPDNKSEVWSLLREKDGRGALLRRSRWLKWLEIRKKDGLPTTEWVEIASGTHDELLPLRKLMAPAYKEGE